MIKPVMKDVFFLRQKSEPALRADLQTGLDLLDTLAAHSSECVGMAANMIGVRKNIIAVNMGPVNVLMFNPRITLKSGRYETEEGCLSLSGQRPCTRYRTITVEYEDINFKKQKTVLQDWPAQIVQHEIDHCNGILI